MPKKKKILIIEDEQTLLEVLTKKFLDEKYDVITALNGKEGLKTALKMHPDLILLDIIMPVMDGMTMLRKLREDKWGKEAEVVILTNLSDVAKVQESLSRGVFDYLVKSDWRLDDVAKIVKSKLS